MSISMYCVIWEIGLYLITDKNFVLVFSFFFSLIPFVFEFEQVKGLQTTYILSTYAIFIY